VHLPTPLATRCCKSSSLASCKYFTRQRLQTPTSRRGRDIKVPRPSTHPGNSFPSQTVRKILQSQPPPKMPSEYRHMSTGSLNIPPPTALNGNGAGQPPAAGMGRFEGPRSPPGRQSQYCRVSAESLSILIVSRYLPCPMQILPARRLPGWSSLPIFS
jgi:hypothetical protein